MDGVLKMILHSGVVTKIVLKMILHSVKVVV